MIQCFISVTIYFNLIFCEPKHIDFLSSDFLFPSIYRSCSISLVDVIVVVIIIITIVVIIVVVVEVVVVEIVVVEVVDVVVEGVVVVMEEAV